MRLRGLVRRLLVHLVPIKPIAVLQEDVCWCGIHHLGHGYVHRLPATLPPLVLCTCYSPTCGTPGGCRRDCPICNPIHRQEP